MSSIRKVSKLRKPPEFPEGVVDIVQRLHKAYGFRPEAYRFVGIGEEVLREAGVLDPSRARAGGGARAAGEEKPRRARKTVAK